MGTTECTGDGKNLERTRFFTRQLITADDLTNEQHYQREKRRMHNRLLHGWGIVCGLNVVEAGEQIVTICPGYALSPQGDEIFLPSEVVLDLTQFAKGQASPCSPCGSISVGVIDITKDFYIAIKYAECMSNPVRVSPVGCGCDDAGCEYSRIRDSFEITCLQTPPATYMNNVNCPVARDEKFLPYMNCPDDPWILLATILGPELVINNIERHVLWPTELLRNVCDDSEP